MMGWSQKNSKMQRRVQAKSILVEYTQLFSGECQPADFAGTYVSGWGEHWEQKIQVWQSGKWGFYDD